MKRSTIFAALSLVFVTNAMAGETGTVTLDDQITSHADINKQSLVVAVTEPGASAVDTAWLLSSQVQGSRADTPILLVLQPETRDETLKFLKLSAPELPALIYLDSNGNQLNRVVKAAPSIKVLHKQDISDDASLI
jgi:hypothetical protein